MKGKNNPNGPVSLFMAILIFVFFSFSMFSCKLAESLNLRNTPDTQISKEGEGANTGITEIINSEEKVEEAGGISKTPETREKENQILSIWIEDIIPETISVKIAGVIENYNDKETGLLIAGSREEADVRLEIEPYSDDSIGLFVIAPAVSFFKISDDLPWEEFRKFWKGEKDILEFSREGESLTGLIITGEIRKLLSKIIGAPENSSIMETDSVEILKAEELGNNVFILMPFDMIEKKYKILSIDGLSVLDENLDIENYPLAFGINIKTDNPEFDQKVRDVFKKISITNRESQEITSLVMTGVTALVRGTANRMEKYGILYPAEKILEILKDADITHISNEVPFAEGCNVFEDRFPFFCSKPEYIELLRYVGTDMVELTGNHMNDSGNEWFLYTLDMYEKEGWPYFGGGRNLEDSYKPALIEKNGNKFAFLGFNWWGPEYDWAKENSPGSAPPHFEIFEKKIKELKAGGYNVIFTFQYMELYEYVPTQQQITDFRRMADAGAVIVSGSQSHQPMGMELRGESFISYGLGNLFFDQMQTLGTRQGLIAKHIFYKNKHINTELVTTMLEDYSQPRLATPDERQEILKAVFNGSIK